MMRQIQYATFAQVIVLLAFISATALVGCGPDFDNPLDPKNNPGGSVLIDKGWTSYERGDIDEAITKFRQAINLAPQNVDARVGLGWSLFLDQDAQGAINEFQSALNMDANAVDAHVGLAGAFLSIEAYQSAIDHAQAALQRRPNYTFVHNPLITSENLHLVPAEGYYYLGDYTKAMEEIATVDASVEIDPDNVESDLLRALEELTQSIDGR